MTARMSGSGDWGVSHKIEDATLTLYVEDLKPVAVIPENDLYVHRFHREESTKHNTGTYSQLSLNVRHPIISYAARI